MSDRPRVRWWRLVDWRVVAAAGLPVWAVVIGFVAWDRTHPPGPPPAPSRVAVSAPVEPAPVVTPLDETTEAPPGPRVIVVPYPVPQPAKAARPARDVPFWLRDESGEVASLEATEPEPESACQTFGTAVKFVKSPTEAMKLARREDKLVCVLHLSGNLEDAGFT